ncbi:MAG: hypothetical protein REI11_14655 [Patulibacter sp.]|nr:hypothetical protein [Patulibacter sp.]
MSALGLTATAAQSASAAAPSACQATAVNLSLLGAANVTANTANPANTPCVADHNGNDVTGLGSIAANALDTTTSVTTGVRADAETRVTGLHADASNVTTGLVAPLTSGANSLIPALSAALSAQLGAGGGITTAIAPLHALGLNITGVDNANLTAQTSAGLPAALSAALPSLVDAGLIDTTASAVCSNGAARLSGSTTLTGVNVLGQTIDANDPVGKVLSVDSANLNLAQLLSVTAVLKSIKVQPSLLSDVANKLGNANQSTLYDVLTDPLGLLSAINPDLPAGKTVASILAAVDTAVAPVLQSTNIPLPAGILHAVVTPQSSVSDGDTQTSTGLGIDISGLGVPLLQGYLARASVTAAAASCDTPPVPTPTPTPTPQPKGKQAGESAAAMLTWKKGEAAAVLECTDVKLRLIDVHQAGKKTVIKGVADASLVGQTADLYLTYGNKKVATTKVDDDGVFEVTVPLPPASIRETNSARYYATISGKRTAALKFARRMYTTQLKKGGTRVRLSGYVTAPLAKAGTAVAIQQRVTCGKYKTVGETKVQGNGHFTATIKKPASGTAVIYRAQTAVPKRAGAARKYATYTLPQPLAL